MVRRVLGWLLALAALLGTGAGLLVLDWSTGIFSEIGTDTAAMTSDNGSTVYFELVGYPGFDVPKLQISNEAGADLTPTLTIAPHRSGGRITAMLRIPLPEYRTEPATILRYAWSLRVGHRLTGEYRYEVPWAKGLQWQRTQTRDLLIYHVLPLDPAAPNTWARLLEELESWTGTRASRPLVIWVYPDLQSMQPLSEADGVYINDNGTIAVHQEALGSATNLTVFHELVHALTPGARNQAYGWWKGNQWFVEGVATLLTARRNRASGWDPVRWRQETRALERLVALARQQPLSPADANRKDGALSPHMMGAAMWLFVWHQRGDQGMQHLLRLFSSSAESPFEVVLKKPFADVLTEWNEYLRSGSLLEDWSGG